MTEGYITYTDGWKYQLAEDYTCKINVIPPLNIKTEYIELLGDGTLTIRHGYAWEMYMQRVPDWRFSREGSHRWRV